MSAVEAYVCPRPAVGDHHTADPTRPATPARRRMPPHPRPGRPGGHPVPDPGRLFLVAAAHDDVRRQPGHRTPQTHRMDPGRALGTPPPGRPEPARTPSTAASPAAKSIHWLTGPGCH